MRSRGTFYYAAILLVWTLYASGAWAQTTWYVDDDAALGGDGTSWSTAFTYLQHALPLATDGDDILVAGGMYIPDRDEVGNVTPGDRNATFRLTSGVVVSGGYAGLANPSSPFVRDTMAHPSILTGDLTGDDGSDFANNSENAYHVVVIAGSGSDTSATLDGFTITGGNADGTFPSGGGMFVASSNPTLINCTFIANTARFYGGGMYNKQSTPTLTNCAFIRNTATDEGGSFFSAGGAMYNEFSNPTLIDCTLRENAADGGGGIYNLRGDSTFLNCIFSRNTADLGIGGAIYTDSGETRATGCLFVGNSADRGGGIYNFTHSPPGGVTLTNCAFSGNSARIGGVLYEGLTEANSHLTFTNCTLAGNTAEGVAGGVYAVSFGWPSRLTLTNCILWGNSDSDGTIESSQVTVGGLSTPFFNYSCIQGWTGAIQGVGNIGDDPLFIDPGGADDVPGTADDDLRVLAGSPVIDAGDNTAVPMGVTTDLDGAPRFLEDSNATDTGNGIPPIVDMGAYESPATCGNGVVDNGEECDDGPANSDTVPDACRDTCVLPSCGDGVVDSGEECDDGNTVSIDGCDVSCRIEIGACCGALACSITLEADCLNSGGVFFGFFSTCDAPDNDGDGLRDECDQCPMDSNKTQPGFCGCGIAESPDSDGDGSPDCVDECPGIDDAIFAPTCVDAIPTVSDWGIVVLSLLLLTTAKIFHDRRCDSLL